MAMKQKRATADKHFIIIYQLNNFIWLYDSVRFSSLSEWKKVRIIISFCDGMSHDNVEWRQLNKNSSSKDIYNANNTVSKNP